MAMATVARVAAECGFEAAEVQAIERANTVEAATERLRPHRRAHELWCTVEDRIAQRVRARLTRVERVEVRLFGLHGVALGRAA
jgi:cobalamin biosynthesis protein CbiD